MVTSVLHHPEGADWQGAVGATWTAEEVARQLQCDLAHVADLVLHGRMIELVTSDGFRLYPVWQFHERKPLPGLVDVLAELPEATVDRWTLAAWCRLPQESLQDRSVADSLSSSAPLEDVLRVCRHASRRWST